MSLLSPRSRDILLSAPRGQQFHYNWCQDSSPGDRPPLHPDNAATVHAPGDAAPLFGGKCAYPLPFRSHPARLHTPKLIALKPRA